MGHGVVEFKHHLISELKRRRVFRALVGYGIVAFAVLQIIEPVMHGLHWSDDVLTYVVVALAAGFSAVAGLAWIYDIKAGRLERTAPAVPGTPLRKRIVVPVLIAIGLVAAAPGLLVYFLLLGGARGKPVGRRADEPSIAVLPLVNMRDEKGNEYFSDGITEEVIDALANVDGPHVASRSSSFAFKGKKVGTRQVAEELHVATVLEGTVQRSGQELRIVVQLIDAASGYHLWSKTYDRELKNVFQLEDELARSIVQALRPKLMPSASTSLVHVHTPDIDAHDLYLQARFLWNKRSPVGLQKAAQLFEKAISLDPEFALAHVGLCESLIVLPAYGWISVPEVVPRSSAAAMKALELDPTLAEAHSCLCLVRARTFEWSGAERECRRAIELRPTYATAHQWYAIALHSMGRVPEALVEARRAELLDPLSAVITNFVAVELYLGRSYEAALAQAQRTVRLDPSFSLGHSYLALINLQLGRYREALAELEPLAGQGNRYDGERGYTYAKMGRRADALRLLADMEERSRKSYVAPSTRALIHIGLGDKEQALRWLERAYAELDWRLLYLKSDPMFDELRPEPRLAAIFERMHLPQTQ